MSKILTIAAIALIIILSISTTLMGWYIYSNWDKLNTTSNDSGKITSSNADKKDTTISYTQLGKDLYKNISKNERITNHNEIEDTMLNIIGDFYEARIAQDSTKAKSYTDSQLSDYLKKTNEGSIGVNISHGWKFISPNYKSYEIIANNPVSDSNGDSSNFLVRITQIDGKQIDELVNITQDEKGATKISDLNYLYNGSDIVKFYGKLHLILATATEGTTSVIIASNEFSIGCSTFSTTECQSFKYDKNQLSFLSPISDYFYGDLVQLKDRLLITETSLGDGGSFSHNLGATNIDAGNSYIIAGVTGSIDLLPTNLSKVVATKCKTTKQNSAASYTLTKKDKEISIESCFNVNDGIATTYSNQRVFIVSNNKILQELNLTSNQKKSNEFVNYDPIKDNASENVFGDVKILGVSYPIDIDKGAITSSAR